MLALAGLASLLAAAMCLWSRSRFHADIVREERLLFAGDAPVGARARSALPPAVREHLAKTLPRSIALPDRVRLEHGGTFRTTPTARWSPIVGRQVFTVARPGFLWHARMTMAPGLWLEVRDCLIEDRGGMRVLLEGAIPIVNASGPEIDQGSAMRWLAETPWFPQAYDGDAIRWEPRGDMGARAHLAWPGPEVALDFTLGEDGRFASVRGLRYFGNDHALHPWQGVYRAYREFAGVWAPSEVEVSWGLPAGEFTYARFHVTRLDYA